MRPTSTVWTVESHFRCQLGSVPHRTDSSVAWEQQSKTQKRKTVPRIPRRSIGATLLSMMASRYPQDLDVSTSAYRQGTRPEGTTRTRIACLKNVGQAPMNEGGEQKQQHLQVGHFCEAEATPDQEKNGESCARRGVTRDR